MNLAVVVQLLSYIQLSATPWAAVPQAFLSLTILWILLTFITIELVMLPNHFILCLIQPSHSLSISSNHLILCHPLLLLSTTLQWKKT